MDYSALSASDGSGESVRATVQSPGRIIGSTAIPVNALTNWPTGKKFIATTGTLRADKTLDPATVQVFYGTASGTTITITGFAPGYTDKGNEIGDVVVIKPSTLWADTVAGFIANATGHGTPDPLTAASINDSNDNKIINLVPVASAVNEVTVQNSATGNAVSLYPSGSDPNIDFNISGKGTGQVVFPGAFALNMKSATNTGTTITNSDQDLAAQGLTLSFTVAANCNALVSVSLGIQSTTDFELQPEIRLGGTVVAHYTPSASLSGGGSGRAVVRSFTYVISLTTGVNVLSAGVLVSSATGPAMAVGGGTISALVLGHVTA